MTCTPADLSNPVARTKYMPAGKRETSCLIVSEPSIAMPSASVITACKIYSEMWARTQVQGLVDWLLVFNLAAVDSYQAVQRARTHHTGQQEDA